MPHEKLTPAQAKAADKAYAAMEAKVAKARQQAKTDGLNGWK